MLGYAVDFDIACTGDGEAIGNASLELSHMGYDFTLLFLASMFKENNYSRVFRPKMAIVWRAGMREGGLSLPLAF